MSRELKFPKMQSTPAPTGYVGALIEDERRLVLVPVDTEEPWEAFRTLRRAMRKENKDSQVSLGMYESPAPIGHQADVIEIESRRRAG